MAGQDAEIREGSAATTAAARGPEGKGQGHDDELRVAGAGRVGHAHQRVILAEPSKG